MTLNYADIERSFITWAQDCPDIRAAVIMGSRARTDHPADEWSDMDIIVFAQNHETYMNHTGWIEQIAPVWLSIPSRTVSNDPERLVLFESGLQVDLVFVPTELLRNAVEHGIIPEPYKRGARAILDKDELAVKLIPPVFTPPTPAPLPSEEEYRAAIEMLWFGAYYVARQMRRGDLLMVQFRHRQLVEVTLHMAEWHARAMRGANLDTWHMGRFIDEWADPRVVNALGGVFAHYDTMDCWHALYNTIDLFAWLARETGDKLGFGYPALTEERLRGVIDGLHVGQA